MKYYLGEVKNGLNFGEWVTFSKLDYERANLLNLIPNRAIMVEKGFLAEVRFKMEQNRK